MEQGAFDEICEKHDLHPTPLEEGSDADADSDSGSDADSDSGSELGLGDEITFSSESDEDSEEDEKEDEDKNIQNLKSIINRVNKASMKGGGKQDKIGYSGGGRFHAWGFRFVK